jgi:hypothetical protein
MWRGGDRGGRHLAARSCEGGRNSAEFGYSVKAPWPMTLHPSQAPATADDLMALPPVFFEFFEVVEA